jgi:hypothetical protein
MKNSIISIGESIHASIPKTGQIMKDLAALGPDAYDKPSGPLNYIKALIESQADDGADFIAVNVDAFGEDNPQTAVDMMRQYVKLVRKWSKGVPVCVDSGNNDVLVAGLKEWFDTKENVRQPLINSLKVYTWTNSCPQGIRLRIHRFLYRRKTRAPVGTLVRLLARKTIFDSPSTIQLPASKSSIRLRSLLMP